LAGDDGGENTTGPFGALKHKLQLALLDGDDRPIIVPTPIGEQKVEVSAEFEVGAQNANEGQVFLFGWAALWDPFK
jgi:hypothetical protein